MNAHLRDNLINLSDGRVVYAQKTTDTGAIGATQTIILSAPAFTPINASRLIQVTARWQGLDCSVVDDIFAFRIMDFGIGQKNEIAVRNQSATFPHAGGDVMTIIASPSAVAHTYNLSGDRIQGSGNMVVLASSINPIQIWVQDIGSA